MDTEKLRELLLDVQQGGLDVDAALSRLRTLPYDDVGNYARLDIHRALRNGMPEVVFCESKTPAQAVAILDRLWAHHDRVLGTRVSPEMAQVIQSQLPDVRYDPISRLVTLTRTELPAPAADAPYAMVICGGTSDLPVAEEATQVLKFLGHRVEHAYDVGVAGLHRLLGELDRLMDAASRHCHRRHGGRPHQRGCRPGLGSRDRRAHERRVRRKLRRRCSPADDAQFLRLGRLRRQHRQRIWGRRLRPPDAAPDRGVGVTFVRSLIH